MVCFGMPTLIETAEIEESAALCRELGLSFVELNMNLPQYQVGKIDVSRFRKIREHYGIFYTIHLDENLNVSDFNPYVADAYLRTVSDIIGLAKALEIPVLNMHLPRGVYFTLPDRKVFLFSEYRDAYLQSIRNLRAMCEREIGDADIKICIENCDGFQEFHKAALEILLDSDVFALTFDVGHDHGCGNLDRSYILENRERLYHMHMHDARGKQNHMPLGTGELDLKQCLMLAEERNCRVVLETKTKKGLAASAAWLREQGY